MAHRLFIAILPPQDVRDLLLDTMEGVEGARWQDDDHLHLTLRFVGELETPAANDLADALGRIDAPPLPLDVAGVGHFERKGRPQAIWAGVPATPELEALRQKVERACASVGLPRETRRFAPHITLARLGSRAGPVGGWLAAHGTLRIGPWQARHFSLFESTLSQAGATYQEVMRYTFNPADAEHR